MKIYQSRLPEEMAQDLKEYAKQEKQPISVIIRFIINDFLKKNKVIKLGTTNFNE